jgi:tetratricopeptide (TPR) repeat protein
MKLLCGSLIFIWCLSFGQIQAQSSSNQQNIQLAQQYLEKGEFDKAIDIYKKLEGDSETFLEIYDDYKTSLRQIKDTKSEEALINKAYLISGKDPIYLFQLALFLEDTKSEKEAQKQLDKALKGLKNNSYQIYQITKLLIDSNHLEWAKQVYLKGKEIFKDPNAFDLDLAYIEGLMGNFKLMSISLIQYANAHPNELQNVTQLIESQIEKKENADIFEEELLRSIGKDKEAWSAIELLAWLYKKQEDYASAFDQIRSLDLLQNEGGTQVLDLARLAYREKDYRTSSKAYNYLIQKGRNHPLYYTASLELINSQKGLIFQKAKFDSTDLLQLKNSYLQIINENFNTYNTAKAKIDLADLEAKYLFQIDSAIALLFEVTEDRNTPKDFLANAKLDLGDYYIMNGEDWESTLLYTQIAKAFKGTPIGEEAKYRNARLAYFKGDFEWALTQLKVIKGNTFELISNDAIELATFISDNFNQDYNENKDAMKSFSEMDLLFFQNKWAEANKIADLMLLNYKGHPIEDDIFFMKAKIGDKLKDYPTEEKYLLKIIDEFPTSILADNALFQLASLYENQVLDLEKAKTYYEKIILEYPDSIFTIDARKRYRYLRGDQS